MNRFGFLGYYERIPHLRGLGYDEIRGTMVWEWVETFKKLLFDPEPLYHRIAFNGDTYSLLFSQKSNDCKHCQSQGQISRLYYWVCSHFCEQLPLLCGQLMLPALKYLGSEPRQVQETTGGVFGRLNSAPSKELLRNVSQMALVCNKDLTGSVWKGPSEGLHQGRVLKFVAHCCELELKLKEAMTEADALRRDLARKEAAPVLVRRIQRLLEEKDKASMKARDLKACLEETRTKLSAETKRCQDLWWSNLELRLEMKKVREEKDLLEALLAEVMAVVEQKSSSGLQGSLSECAGRHLVP